MSDEPTIPSSHDFTEDGIWLLKINHVDAEAQVINCSLQRFARSESHATDSLLLAPPYEALSYAWGPEHPQQTIVLNGERMAIRENLWQFFYHAVSKSIEALPEEKAKHGAKPYTASWLWVDAICINQQDVAARSREVQRMSTIYELATRVIVWLGVMADHSEEAIRYVYKSVRLYRFLSDNHLLPQRRYEEEKQPGEWLVSNEDQRQGLLSLLARPYWKRLWVVQEVVLAQRVSVACGGIMIDLWDFTFFKWTFSAPWLLQDDFMEAVSRDWPWLLTPLKQSVENRKRQCKRREDPGLFLHVLERFSDRDCEDARDKVYGLVGLADARHVPRVDYTLQPGEVFWQAMRYAVEGLPKFSRVSLAGLSAAMGVTGFESNAADATAAKNLDTIYETSEFTDAVNAFNAGEKEAMGAVCQCFLLDTTKNHENNTH